jgi:DNA-binding response OmpR family regulator
VREPGRPIIFVGMSNIVSGSQWTASQCDVLIVEDDVVQSEEMAAFLARSGLTVQTAHNGSAAIPLAEQLRPRVALLDYNLPDLNGVELAEAIRALLPDTAIIMMSGRIEGLAELTLEKIGISVFVNKPVPLGPLRQAVQRLVKTGRVVYRSGPGNGG